MSSPRTKRAIRLPTELLQQLRDLRDSYVTPRPVPDLVRACLRNTEYGVAGAQKQLPATRKDSEKIDIWLDAEHATMLHKDIVAKVEHVLKSLGDKTIPANIRMHREGVIR